MKKQNKGFTLVEIMIVVAIIGLLAAIGIPSFSRARANSIEKAKANNIRILEGAIEEWAMEKGHTNGATIVYDEVYEYVKGATAAADLSSATGPLAVGDNTIATMPTIVGGTAAY